MITRKALAFAAAGIVAAGTGSVAAMASGGSSGTPVTVYACVHTGSSKTLFDVNTTAQITCPAGSFALSWQGMVPVVPSPSPSPSTTSPSPSPSVTTPTPTPSPSATVTPTPSPSPSTTGAACVVSLGNNCGPYDYAGIPMSNGFDTYVANQSFANSGTTETITATDPGNWSMVANVLPLGSLSVQTFPDVQQLANDWNGSGWGGSGSSDTPLDSLTTLSVTYSETSPTGPCPSTAPNCDIYEFAPDVWSANYNADVMFWADTHGRCDAGAFGGTVLGNVLLDGQPWTVHRYGGFGAEIIFVLDGSGGSGTCAQQPSGTIDIKEGFDWLTSNGFVTGSEVVTQINTGWEITSASNANFAMTSYGITATP